MHILLENTTQDNIARSYGASQEGNEWRFVFLVYSTIHRTQTRNENEIEIEKDRRGGFCTLCTQDTMNERNARTIE